MKVTIKKKGPTFGDLPDGAKFTSLRFPDDLLFKLRVKDVPPVGYNAFVVGVVSLWFIGPNELVSPVDVEEIIAWAH